MITSRRDGAQLSLPGPPRSRSETAIQAVVTGVAVELVGAESAEEPVVTVPADKPVVAVPAEQRVVPPESADHVGAGRAL